MPRQKKGLKVGLAPRQPQDILPPQQFPTSYEERQELKAIFASPLMKKIWANARTAKPSAFPDGLNGALGNQVAVNRLHEIRGWEMFEVALIAQTMDPPKRKGQVPDNFPDSGRVIPEKKPLGE